MHFANFNMDRELLPLITPVSVTGCTDDLSCFQGCSRLLLHLEPSRPSCGPSRPLPLVTFPSRSHDDTGRVNQLLGAEFEQKAFDMISEIDIGVTKSAVQVSFMARMF